MAPTSTDTRGAERLTIPACIPWDVTCMTVPSDGSSKEALALFLHSQLDRINACTEERQQRILGGLVLGGDRKERLQGGVRRSAQRQCPFLCVQHLGIFMWSPARSVGVVDVRHHQADLISTRMKSMRLCITLPAVSYTHLTLPTILLV